MGANQLRVKTSNIIVVHYLLAFATLLNDIKFSTTFENDEKVKFTSLLQDDGDVDIRWQRRLVKKTWYSLGDTSNYTIPHTVTMMLVD